MTFNVIPLYRSLRTEETQAIFASPRRTKDAAIGSRGLLSPGSAPERKNGRVSIRIPHLPLKCCYCILSGQRAICPEGSCPGDASSLSSIAPVMGCRVVRLLSKDVFSNLAAEECLFQAASSGSRMLLFYINSAAVVLGRTQNPFFELDLDYAAQTGMAVSRRRSGGGTVVHDEGNLNFCFMTPRDQHDPASNSQLIVDVLRNQFGVDGQVSKRGDIMVCDRKVSGAAFRITRDRAYHHGTLLVDSNLPQLRRLLKSPHADNMAVTGAASVPSPVLNLSEVASIDIPNAITAISGYFVAKYGESVPDDVIETIDNDKMIASKEDYVRERMELRSREWVYGQVPRFSYRIAEVSSSPCLHPRHFVLFMSKGCRIERVREQSIISNGCVHFETTATETSLSGIVHERYTSLLAGALFEQSAIVERIKAASTLSSEEELKFMQHIASSIPKQHICC